MFLLLAFLCYQAHPLARHLVGAALCGGCGYMTVAVTTTRPPCVLPPLVTLRTQVDLWLPVLFLLPVGNAILFGANGNTIQGRSFPGIPLIVLLTGLFTGTLFVVFMIKYLYPHEAVSMHSLLPLDFF